MCLPVDIGPAQRTQENRFTALVNTDYHKCAPVLWKPRLAGTAARPNWFCWVTLWLSSQPYDGELPCFIFWLFLLHYDHLVLTVIKLTHISKHLEGNAEDCWLESCLLIYFYLSRYLSNFSNSWYLNHAWFLDKGILRKVLNLSNFFQFCKFLATFAVCFLF